MSDAWDFDEDVTNGQADNDNAGPKPLRDAYKKAVKDNADLLARLEKIEQAQAQSQVADVFRNLGVDPAVATSYKGDTTSEAIESWVNNMRTAFGGAPSAGAPASPPALDADTQSAYQRTVEAGQNAPALGTADAAMASVKDAKNMNELLAAWNNIK